MFKKMVVFIALLFTISLFNASSANAQSRLQQIGKGVNKKDQIEVKSEDEEKGKNPKEKFSDSDTLRRENKASLHDIIFLGVFETYIPTKRYNARLTVYAEPRKFILGHRACTKVVKLRDKINTHLFKNPPKVDKKGRVNTEGMDEGVRKAIKKALKTKLEYFTSVYVFSGRFNTNKVPKDLKGQTLTDCAGMIEKKKELDKAKK